MTRLTNERFAETVGCDFTTASKIRHGKRLPSLALFARMVGHYKLDANEGVQAYLRSRADFTAWMNERVFEAAGDPADEPATATATEPTAGTPTFQEPTFREDVA